MFETTIAKDLQSAVTPEKRRDLFKKIHLKYRGECMAFIEELKQLGIAQELYNSSKPEETIAIWKKFFQENQELIARIRLWALRRFHYFDVCDPVPMWDKREKLDCILEIGLMVFLVGDECIFLGEDIYEGFDKEVVALLKKSSNTLLNAAGYYIEAIGYEDMSLEGIYDFYS